MQGGVMEIVFLIGRIIFGVYWINAGIHHFTLRKMMVQYAAAKGTPAPEVAVLGTGVLALLGGLSVLLGFRPDIGCGLIALFLIGVTPKIHDFWTIKDPQQRMAEMNNFTKNTALLGAALMILTFPQPWRYGLG
jgi:putative oxidoreductase